MALAGVRPVLRLPEIVAHGAAARERTIEVHPAFGELFGSLQRGSTVGCTGTAAVSLALALASTPSHDGAWVGVAGLPALGLRAAVELGVSLERLVLVNEPPARFADAQWADVVAALIDGFDLVVLGPGVQRVRSATARRLQARAQSRGAVLLLVGENSAFGCDLELHAGRPRWHGLGDGHGVASDRTISIELRGRRMPRPRTGELLLPAPDGSVAQPEHELTVPTVINEPAELRRTG